MTIHTAAIAGDLEIVRQLIEAGADVNARDRLKRTPLMEAASKGHVELARYLIDAGADVNARERAHPLEEGKRTALHYACDRSGSQGLSIAEMLLEAGANPNAASSLYVPLNIACAKGNLAMVKLLLKHGADPNGHKKFDSPLKRAADNAHFRDSIAVVRELVAHGADPNRGDPAICYTMSPSLSPKAFFEGPNRRDPQTCSVEMTKELLRLGADINARNCEGDTALHCSVRSGSYELVELCVSQGSDVNALGRWELPPLALVSSNPRMDVARLLIDAGADVNHLFESKGSLLECFERDTSCHYKEERQAVIEFLRSRGAKTFAELKAEKRKHSS